MTSGVQSARLEVARGVCVETEVSAIVPRQKGQDGPWLERWAGVMSQRSPSLRMASVMRVKGSLGRFKQG